MRVSRSLLKAATSVTALLTGMLHNDAASIRRQREAFAPTKRKPDVRRKALVADPKRAEARRKAKARADRQFRKEREIGTDPLYAHRQSTAPSRADWLKKSREWDRKNGGRA
jgi:hypothetical protein